MFRARARGTGRAPWMQAPGAGRLAGRRGVTAVVLALSIVPLAGIAALVVDVGMLYRSRRNAQTAADAAALAYAWECYRFSVTPGATACSTTLNTTANTALVAAATSNGYTNNASGAAVSATALTWPQSGTTPWGTAPAIQVTIQDTVRSFFGGVFGRARTVVNARGTATWSLAPSTACVMTLEPTADNALYVQGNPAVNAPGCSVVINSSGSSAAVTSGNQAEVTAGAIAVTGGTSGSGFSPTPTTGVPPALNPLAYLSTPTIPTSGSCVSAGFSLQPNNTGSYSAAGCSVRVFTSQVQIQGAATFGAGTYVFQGGFQVTSQGSLTGTGVTFINMPAGWCNVSTNNVNQNCQIQVQAGASLNVSAPTADPYRGILFYQQAAEPFAEVWANSGSTFNGTIYFPNASLRMGGTPDVVVNGQVIADQIRLAGNGSLTVNAPTAANGGFYPGKRVTLVD